MMMAAAPAPTPTPAFAPVDNPEDVVVAEVSDSESSFEGVSTTLDSVLEAAGDEVVILVVVGEVERSLEEVVVLVMKSERSLSSYATVIGCAHMVIGPSTVLVVVSVLPARATTVVAGLASG
jgi:hypothetical protein